MPIDSEPKLRSGAWLYLDVMTEGMQVCDTREEAEAYVHEGAWCQVILQIAEVYPGGRPNRALLEMRAARVADDGPGLEAGLEALGLRKVRSV